MRATTCHQLPASNEVQRVRGAILGTLSDSTVLMGTLASLARGLGTTESVVRTCLRELLVADWIVLEADGHGRLTIREPRRIPTSLPAIRPRRRAATR